MSTISTTFYLPDDPGLLGRTYKALLMDMRIAEDLVALSETLGFAAKSSSRGHVAHGDNVEVHKASPVSILKRTYRRLLPGNHSADAKALRERYGWTAQEIVQITQSIVLGANVLRVLSERCTLKGTAATLQRDSDLLMSLADEWASVKGVESEGGKKAGLRRFILLRVDDVSGSSGTGIVARGVEHQPSKWCVLFWEDSFKFFPTREVMMSIHSHEGRTRFHWQDK